MHFSMVQLNDKNELNLMLDPILVKIQHGIRAYVLNNSLHKIQASHPLTSSEPYDPPRVFIKSIQPSLLGYFNTLNLDVGDRIVWECMASLNAPLASFRFHFQSFCIFGPRVSSVSQFSTEISELGFLQLIKGASQLTSVLLTFKAYCWH
jgi:hypothetical protein